MDSQPPQGPHEQQVQLNVPPDQLAGSYADFVGIWHTPNIFVLDFAALAQAPVVRAEGNGAVTTAVAQVVSRVRIPPSQVFEIMKGLEQQLSAWEKENGISPAPPSGT